MQKFIFQIGKLISGMYFFEYTYYFYLPTAESGNIAQSDLGLLGFRQCLPFSFRYYKEVNIASALNWSCISLGPETLS